MYYPSDSRAKIKFAALAAGALAYLLHKQRDAVGLYTFSTGIDAQTEVKSTSTHIHKLFLELQNVLNAETIEQKTNVASTLNEIAQKIHRRSLVVIFSDMFQDREDMTDILAALQHLKHKKHEILMFHITDKKTELDFDFEDRPYEFYDLEDGTKLKVTPSEIKSSYQNTMKEYYSELRLKCGQLKIDFIEADVNDDFDTIFSAYLIKRSRMS
jgi:uncharacterized protein (DUF58 family)